MINNMPGTKKPILLSEAVIILSIRKSMSTTQLNNHVVFMLLFSMKITCC